MRRTSEIKTALLYAFLGLALISRAHSSFAQNFRITDRPNGNAFQAPGWMNQNPNSHSLRIFWWNIMNGGELGRTQQQAAIAQGNTAAESPLEENLRALAAPITSPELIILGEYMPKFANPKLENQLLTNYPYQLYVPDNASRIDRGIQIYSKYPFTSTQSVLDWSPYFKSSEEQKQFKAKWKADFGRTIDYFYTRAFVEITVSKNQEVWHVIPNHFLNNWVELSEKIGKEKTALMILFGVDNPHFYQTERLVKEKLEPIEAMAHTDHSHVVVLGDFNAPSDLYGVSTSFYRLMRRELHEDSVREFTYPAVSANRNEIKQLEIDHAFFNQSTRAENFLRVPLKGSDHYPILFDASTSD